MPPTTSKPAPKRKPPTFKPPRPTANAKSTKQPPAPRRKSAPTKSKRPSFIADEASASEEEEEEDNNDDDDDDDDDEIPSDDAMPIDASSDASQTSDPALPSTSTQDPPQTIPPALLTKLLHHHFKGERTRIGKEADGVVGKYMETFVREAIARAAFERAESGKEGGGGGWSGGFLEVEDLEKLAPQLILDF